MDLDSRSAADHAPDPRSSGPLYQLNEGCPQQHSSVADSIVREIRPATVLQVGCGTGLLVRALRQRGVEVQGIDAVEHAIRNVPPDTQPHCWVGSATDGLSQRYDLIICVGGLENLTPSEEEQAVESFCQHSDDVLFSSSRSYSAEDAKLDEKRPEYWVELFARNGFFRDLDFDASFVAPWAMRFRRATEPALALAAYEHRLRLLERESQARRELNIAQRNEVMSKERTIQTLRHTTQTLESKVPTLEAEIQTQLETIQTLRHSMQTLEAETQIQRQEIQQLRGHLKDWEAHWANLESTIGWALLRSLQRTRARLAPPGSKRDQLVDKFWHEIRVRKEKDALAPVSRAGQATSRRAREILWRLKLAAEPPLPSRVIEIEEIEPRAPVQPHQASVEIIVCVHNALSDVQRCLDSVLRHTTAPYSLILVDDGSDAETRDYLAGFAEAHGVTLLRNEEPRRYTRAANQGLRRSTAEYVVLLNSDALVTPQWLDRLVACIDSDRKIGLVGPLSNTASWQSIPEIESAGDWASNPLPEGMTAEEMARLVASHSARMYPTMPFLNGFCLLIRRQVVDEIGFLDESNFSEGYGEENDYALRAREAGWQLALADDVYVYHAHSRSYSSEARRRLSEQADRTLTRKHGLKIITQGVAICQQGRVLEGIRARSRAMLDRQRFIREGRSRFAERLVLFVLPINVPGGGGNVVIDEARAMRAMGAEVVIFNLKRNQAGFELAYPALDIPVLYGNEKQLSELAKEYEAVVATANCSVEWMAPIAPQDGPPVRGYYVQDFEPYMHPPGTEGFRRAFDSYTLFPGLVRFTKTEWTRQEVRKQTGAGSTVVGASVNIDLFRPRPRSGPEWPDRPLRIAAMVRPYSPYRAPKLTMELLNQASRRYRAEVEIVLFGTTLDDPGFRALPHDFAWSLAGILGQKQVAQLLNEVDVFVDFSSHQAMGLTALEAMACGVAVIVPRRGGAVEFARQEANSLVVDTSSPGACWRALQRLVEDHDLRSKLQRNALIDVCSLFPERPAFNILSTLFD